MSRTFKDKRRRHFSEYWKRETLAVEYESINLRYDGSRVWYYYLQLPTTKPKLRKEVDTEDHWMSTPSWWTRLTMNKPQRRSVHLWERKALFSDLEELMQPGKKVAHIYYW